MSLKEICLPLQNEINQVESYIRSQLSSDVPFVENVVEYVINNGGKRIRPILTILSAKLSGYQGEDSVRIGSAIEFTHTASLLHDDVLDNAQLRRGRVSTNKKWGNHVSVLVGDFFYCRAMDILVRQGDLRILKSVTDAITTTTEGEIFEITKSNDPSIAQEDYLEIIKGKTAALMGAGCHSGAILGNVSEEYEHSLRRFGYHLGIAFQLMDDALDYTLTTEEFGKQNGTDLKEGKLTLPLILSLKRASDADAQVIKNSLIADSLDADTFKNVLRIIQDNDGIEDTIKLATSYIGKAKEQLERFRPSLEKDILQAIADYVINRKN